MTGAENVARAESAVQSLTKMRIANGPALKKDNDLPISSVCVDVVIMGAHLPAKAPPRHQPACVVSSADCSYTLTSASG